LISLPITQLKEDVQTFHLSNFESFTENITNQSPHRDAKSFELSEDQANNKLGLECYNFNEKLDKPNPKLLKGKSANSNDRSDDSSGDNSRTESELMEDPDLYQPNLQRAESEKRAENYNCDDLDMLTGAEKMLPKLRLEGTTSVISPNEGVYRGNLHHQKGNHFREPMFCTDDANIAADPQRVSERPEIMRLNSYDNIVPLEAMAATNKNNQENIVISPTQPHHHHHSQNNHDSHPLQSSRKSSACRKSLSMSKTKKESKQFFKGKSPLSPLF